MSALLSITPLNNILLTHLSQEPHICINNLDHHWFRWWPVTSWTNADLLLIGSLGTNFSGIRTQIQNFHKSLWNVYEMAVIMSRERWVNSLVPSDATWRHRTMSTLVQVMACCLTAPSHYLNQCWLNIIRVLWHSLFLWNAQDIYPWYEFQNYLFEITAVSPRGQWVKSEHPYWSKACYINSNKLRPDQNAHQFTGIH